MEEQRTHLNLVNQLKPNYRLITTVLLLLLSICGCSTEERQPYTGSDSKTDFPYYSEKESKLTEKRFRAMPWELWNSGRDLNGQPLVNISILTGDELVKEGRRLRALETYLGVDRSKISPNEHEALVLRTAGMQLSLRQAQKALDTISAYFTAHNRGADAVPPEFALVLGFAYGHTNNIPQSLAWFSRVHALSPVNGSFDQVASAGAKRFLRSVPQDKFEPLADAWRQDAYVTMLIGQERQLRATLGGTILPPPGDEYGEFNTGTVPVTGSLVQGGTVSVGALLPLSGKFGTLGRNTLNGIELALSASAAELGTASDVNVVSRDSAGDQFVSISHAREIMGVVRPTVVFGPLLTDPSNSVSDVSRELSVPMLTFSKKNSFPVGQGVYRLGATADSQVASLVSACQTTLNLRRFALIYSDDANGLEFAAAFKGMAARAGIEILFERGYVKDDYSQILLLAQEVEKYQVQAIFFPDNLLAASRFASALSQSFRDKVRLLGTASWADPNQLVRFQTPLDKAIFVNPFIATSQRPFVQKFVESYRSRFGSDPEFLAAQGFDGATIVLAALRKMVQGQMTFAQAMMDVGPYAGLTGRITVNGTGELERVFALAELNHGTISEILSDSTPVSFIYRGDSQIAGNPNTLPVEGHLGENIIGRSAREKNVSSPNGFH